MLARRDRALVLGCAIDRLDMRATVRQCDELIVASRPAQQVSVNVAKLVAMRRDPALRDFVGRCSLVNADGQPVVWASRLLGDPLPERVAGIDLMQELLALAERRGHRVFVLGARQDILEGALGVLRRIHPRLDIAGRDGYFTDAETPSVCDEIRAFAPQILLVAMSSPRKERWLARYANELDVPLSMGVGGSIDVVVGAKRRAPSWMRRAGLEWLARLAQEPRRLAIRYLATNTVFVLLLARELVAARLRTGVRAS